MPPSTTSPPTIPGGTTTSTANPGWIFGFGVGSGGALTALTGSPYRAGIKPSALVADPTNRFVYVTDYASNQLIGYGISSDQTCSTSSSAAPTRPATSPPPSPSIPRGRFLYVANALDSTVSAYAIDLATGIPSLAINTTGSQTNNTDTQPVSIVVDPALGRYVFTANSSATRSPASGSIPTPATWPRPRPRPTPPSTTPRACLHPPWQPLAGNHHAVGLEQRSKKAQPSRLGFFAYGPQISLPHLCAFFLAQGWEASNPTPAIKRFTKRIPAAYTDSFQSLHSIPARKCAWRNEAGSTQGVPLVPIYVRLFTLPLLALICIPSRAIQPPPHDQFKVAVYIPVGVVQKMQDPAYLQKSWADLTSQVRVDKVYIENYRSGVFVDESLLANVKAFFVAHGVKVAGGWLTSALETAPASIPLTPPMTAPSSPCATPTQTARPT